MAKPQYTPEELSKEEWRPVVGYEGWYSVSDLGRVRRDRKGNGAVAGRILRVYDKAWRGYLSTHLSRNCVVKPVRVHALVAQAFIGPAPRGEEINHKDNRTDNPRLTNLEYGTHQYNVDHTVNLGRHARGSRSGRSKLTEAVVLEIREMRRSGAPLADIAAKYNVTKGSVCMIANRRTWRHI